MGGQARIVRIAEARRTAWRNGGGETFEIAAHPAGADLGAFGWRVSLARIERDGPFSAFPRVDRVFAVVDGDGVDLGLDAGPPLRLTPDDAPKAFPGEASCRCHLLDGPVTALNVMVARGAFECALTRHDPGRGLPTTAEAVRIVVCAEGTLTTTLGAVERHDAIVMPAGERVRIAPGASPTRVLVAVIGPMMGTQGP